VLASRLGAEIRIEGQQSIDTRYGCAQLSSDDFGSFKRDVPKPAIDFLERAENQFLAFLPITRLKLRYQHAYDIEIDLAGFRLHVCIRQLTLPASETCNSSRGNPIARKPFGSIEAA